MNLQSTPLEQTKDAIKRYIAEQFLYDRPELTLTADFPLIQQQVIDSLQIIQLITFLQEHFDILFEIEDLVLENFSSIQAIAALVQKQKAVVL
jgi:acyl carrier protein